MLDDGSFEIPNSTALGDDHIWRCSFLAMADAEKFMMTLQKLELNTSQGPDSDAVLVSEFDGSIEPYCEWLTTAAWDKALIGWKTGTHPKTVVAREGWDPKVGSGLRFRDPTELEHLKFLRLEDKVEVFLDTRTGEEIYLGRTSTPVDALFLKAAEIIRKHYVTAGEPNLTGNAALEVSKATEMLQSVVAEKPDWWNAQWFYGKGLFALGKHELAYQAFRRAYALENQVEAILRELVGVCLELGRFDEAVKVAEQAVKLAPDNSHLIGNLALAYLMAGRIEQARKSIDAAIRIAPGDSINQLISQILLEILQGTRAVPKSLADLNKPAKSKWTRLLEFW